MILLVEWEQVADVEELGIHCEKFSVFSGDKYFDDHMWELGLREIFGNYIIDKIKRSENKNTKLHVIPYYKE
jgi:hypothetical protein